jgi:hypothetical protein
VYQIAARAQLAEPLRQPGRDPLACSGRKDVGKGLPPQVVTVGGVTDDVFHCVSVKC